ncbi:MAG: PAS domain-containing protein [Dongiaceae bacterium]
MDQTTAYAAAILSDVLRHLVAHWQRMRACRRMPARADFDPLDARFALGHISLIDVHRDPSRFYFRLDGTKQVDLFGVDCTRRYLDEAMPGDHAEMASASYREVVECREPRYHRRRIPFHERLIDYEIVILPFSNDSQRVDMLMTGIVPDRPS